MRQSGQYTKSNKLDLQKKSNNEFIMRKEKAAGLAKFIFDYDTYTKYIS